MPPPYLLLLTAAHTHRHQPAYRAMEVLSPPWKNEPFPGWLYAPLPRAVRVGLPHQRIVHASTSRGSVWYADGRQLPEHDDLRWLTLVGAALSHSVKFNPPVSGVLLPAFVSSDARLRPCRRRAAVRLHARRFIDLPDFNATLAELSGYAHASRRVLSQPLGPEFADAMQAHPNPFIARMHAAAARTELGPGLHLPVAVDHAPARVHGVLRLDAQREPGVFESTVRPDRSSTSGRCWTAPGVSMTVTPKPASGRAQPSIRSSAVR